MGLLLKKALDQAAVWHRAQKRKYPGADVPYVSHIAGVAITLARHGFSEEVIAAGALHDTLEDTEATVADLKRLFGARVAELVVMVSEEDKSLSWEERKKRYLEHFPKEPWEAQAITLADKLDNFESILITARDYGDPWAQFKRGRSAQLERFGALEAMLAQLKPHGLIDEYRRALVAISAL